MNISIPKVDRHLHDRLLDHKRAAVNPPSYPNNSMGQHYAATHLDRVADSAPCLTYEIMDIKTKTLERKMSEAIYINKQKPSLNDKSEFEDLIKYIIDNDPICKIS